MDLSIPGSTNSTMTTPLTPVFGDNVQQLLSAGALQVKPISIITVNSIADAVDTQAGVTTLRDAINKANADVGEDLILFDRSLFSTAQTISLRLGELNITHNLDIIAPRDSLTGADLVTVSGNKATRVFEIGNTATVSLNGLIVTDGLVTKDDGGGIRNSGTLTLESSIVRNNSARNGGGIFTNNGTKLTVSNSTINSNSAILNPFGSALSGVNGGDTGNGGGIFDSSGSIFNTTSSTIEISNSNLSGNSAGNVGGGIANTVGSVLVSNSTLSGNSAGSGGGGAIYSANPRRTSSTLTVKNSTISGNSTTGGGGGIYNSESSTAEVSDSTISNNSGFFGGGVYSDTDLTVSNTIILANVGSGITSSGAALKVSDSTISYNSSNSGGGIDTSSQLTMISNTKISNNKATGNSFGGSGGGIYNTAFGISSSLGVTFKISNSIISNNSATSDGGGIYSQSAPLELDNSTISSNNSAKGNGGGIYGGGTISNSTISNNSAAGSGGGIYGSSTISNSTISNNSAAGSGGGIYNLAGGTVWLSNSTLSNNTAGNNGGGIYNTTIERQVSRTGFIAAQGIVNATNSTLSGNTAGNTGGGIYSIGAVTLLFSTLTLNQAANGGGVFNGVFIGMRTGTTPGSVNARNTIIAANRSSAGGINPDVSGTFSSNGYNLIGNSTGSTGFGKPGDIVGTSTNPINPLLGVLASNGGPTQTIALLPDSPAINAADPILLSTDPTTDQRGFPRVSGGRADIGAFEFS